MEQHTRQRQKPQNSLYLRTGFILGIAASIALSAILFHQIFPDNMYPRRYEFLATEDHFFENPANWSPAYPGNQIAPGDTIVLHELTYVSGFPISISGNLTILPKAQLFSADGAINIHPGGSLDNFGELFVPSVDNAGKLDNHLAALTDIHSYHAQPTAITTNLKNGSFKVNRTMLNQGQFYNFGQCIVGQEMVNDARFYQDPHSELFINGQSIQSVSLNHPSSVQ